MKPPQNWFAVQFEIESHLTAEELAVFLVAVMPRAFDIAIAGDNMEIYEHPGAAKLSAADLAHMMDDEESTEGSRG